MRKIKFNPFFRNSYPTQLQTANRRLAAFIVGQGMALVFLLAACMPLHVEAADLRNDRAFWPYTPVFNLKLHPGGSKLLNSFTGNVRGCEIELSWGTNLEIGNDYFEIERSIDGKRFFPIGSVKGAGNSISPRNYQFSDGEVFKSDYYYRLRLVDFNGEHLYSDVIQVSTACHREGVSIDNVFPNPNAINWINVQIYTDRDMTDAVLVIKDLADRKLQQLTTEIKPGVNLVLFDSKDLEEGTYTIHIMEDVETAVTTTFTK